MDTDIDTDTEYDCNALPSGLLSYEFITGVVTGEDFAFDDEGNLVGMSSPSLFKSTRAGVASLWISDAECVSGLRALPSGDFVCNSSNSLMLFDAETGARTIAVTGLEYPNGIEVGLDGMVYVSTQSSGNVVRIDPYMGEAEFVASGLSEPNGLTFSPDYTRLYVGSFCGGAIYAIDFDSAGAPIGQEEFLTTSDAAAVSAGMTGCFDGMGVDMCGNLYVCDYGNIHVYRIKSDASQVETVADLSAASSWIPNMQWGSGVGGWLRKHLYVIDISAGVFEIPVEVPGKVRAYP